jgi:tRNA dimethylallyltransferase
MRRKGRRARKKAAPKTSQQSSLNEPTVILIAGPTAAGKTAAAIRLAQYLQTDIISADSRQCFRELDIGVARPSPDELRSVHHYFIASHSITDAVNAALFEELSLQWATDIFRQRDTVVMVGGTGLYIKAFCEGLDSIPPVDPAIRDQVRAGYSTQGLGWLQEQVRASDPAFYGSAEIHNPRRLMRALEVVLSTGNSILSYRTGPGKPRPFKVRKIGLQLPKEQLHRNIHTRVDRMMELGLLGEVKGLLPYRDCNALQTVGYTELFSHLEGRLSLDQAVEEIKKNTRRYAKRQMTWFRKDPSIHWVDPSRFDPAQICPKQ